MLLKILIIIIIVFTLLYLYKSYDTPIETYKKDIKSLNILANKYKPKIDYKEYIDKYRKYWGSHEYGILHKFYGY